MRADFSVSNSGDQWLQPSVAEALTVIFINTSASPPTSRPVTQIPRQINTQDRYADNHCDPDDQPLGQVGVNDCVEHPHEERSVRGFDPCLSFEMALDDAQRARRP